MGQSSSADGRGALWQGEEEEEEEEVVGQEVWRRGRLLRQGSCIHRRGEGLFREILSWDTLILLRQDCLSSNAEKNK